MDRREFVDSFHHAYKAVMFPGNPFPDPTTKGFTLDNEDGTFKILTFTDTPLNRAGFAITRKYRGDPEKAQIFLLRYLALPSIWDDPRSEQWRRQCDDGSEEINDAVIHAAAITPLTRHLEFDLDLYFQNVREIASEDDAV